MAVTSIIKLSEFEGTKRIDAEYYQPYYMELQRVINNLTVDKVSALAHSVRKGVFDLSPTLYREDGVPFIRVQNIREGFLSEGDLVFISPSTHKAEIRTELESHDILLSKIGTIGEVSIVPSKFPKVNYSQNVIGVKIDKGKIPPGYMLIFLLTLYGQFQLHRIQMPQVQSKLELDPVRSLKVVRLGDIEREIHEKVLEIEKLLQASKSFYSEAENLLLEELGLKDFKLRYQLSYSANLCKAFAVHRIDAEYFQPAYGEIIKKILEYQNDYTNLLSCVESVKPDFDPKKYPDKTFSYVELADIDASIGIIHSTSEIKGEEAPSRARRFLRENDLIVSSVEGSLEKVALAGQKFEGALASTGFFQFRPIKILPEVLLVLSKSIILQIQLKKECAGTILTAVPNESLRRILIPVLPEGIQQKIASLVQQSHEARKKARKLLEEAKRKVEEIIEYRIQK